MANEILGFIDTLIKKEFDLNRRILSMDEYLHLVTEHPERQLRGSAKYGVDMMDHFGKEPLPIHTFPGVPATGASVQWKFNVFNSPKNQNARAVVGHEAVQNDIYRALKTFARQGSNNKLILLHGPNGSAKSSLIQAFMAGIESYSEVPEGATYTFNWIFPAENLTKGGMGLNTYTTAQKEYRSYAKLPDDEIMSRIPTDLKDHPILLIPVEQRKAFLEKLIGSERASEIWPMLPQHLSRGSLSHNSKQIADALLIAYNGDFKKLLMHVQVERLYFSRRYRKGLVTIEPQMHVDAQYHQLTYNKSMGNLPACLQGLNLFALTGDLIDGNRGVIEFSDLLKRPIDTFKYLLTACETNAINIGQTIAYIDTIMLGSTNELQLDAFKEFPDFTSFKARIELIRVPYLVSVSQERQIYKEELAQVGLEKHVAPHTDWALATWAILTRLKKPNSINYPPNISAIVSGLTPLEKVRLYDNGEMPHALSPDERKLLRASLKKIREEYQNIPYYEGRMGASAREMRSILSSAAQNPEFQCLSPLSVMIELEEFIKHVSEYEFLKQDVKDGFHDAQEFINITRNEYLSRVDREVRDSIGLYDSNQWEDFLKKYVNQVSSLLKKEKIKSTITGRNEEPDLSLINELERIVEAPQEASAKEAFRQNMISQIGAWSLDHPSETVTYSKVFPEYWAMLEKHYFESQKALLSKMHDALIVYANDTGAVTEEGRTLANKTVTNMVSRLGYCEHCAKEVITFLMRQRY